MAFQDIRKSRKWLSVEEARLLLFALVILAAMLAINVSLARSLPGGEWFFLRWSGARAFLIEKVAPYSTTIAERVQQIVYRRNASADEYSYVLNDPFYIVLLYSPLVFFQTLVGFIFPSVAPFFDYAFARGVWMLISELVLAGTVWFSFNLSEWQPSRGIYILLFGFGLFGYFSLNALVSASPAIFLGLLYISVLLSLRSFSDELAGALLFLAAYQWEVSGLFFLFVIFWVFANRRWNVLTGLGMSFFILLAVSFLIYPGWALPYTRAVLSDWYRSSNLHLGYYLSHWLPQMRLPLGTLASLILGVLIFFEWLGSVQSHFRRVVWTACLSLAATPLMGFAIFPSNHVVLILPLILILALVWERWSRYRILAFAFILSLVLVIPYGLFLRGNLVSDRIYSDLLTVLPPAGTVIGLYWMRWWAVRSPRTWLDQTGYKR